MILAYENKKPITANDKAKEIIDNDFNALGDNWKNKTVGDDILQMTPEELKQVEEALSKKLASIRKHLGLDKVAFLKKIGEIS